MPSVSGFADFDPAGAREPAALSVSRAALRDLPELLRVQASAGRLPNEAQLKRAIPASNSLVLVARPAETAPGGGGQPIIAWAQANYLKASLDDAPDGHYLAGVTVAPQWRRRGVAGALTTRRLRWIGERADEAFFVVNPANRASLALHTRWGFEEVLRAPRLAGVSFSGGVGLLMRAPTQASWWA